MSVQTSISTAALVYGIAALIAMFVSLLIKITYSIVNWSQRKANRS
jgi:hypothetical protein